MLTTFLVVGRAGFVSFASVGGTIITWPRQGSRTIQEATDAGFWSCVVNFVSTFEIAYLFITVVPLKWVGTY